MPLRLTVPFLFLWFCSAWGQQAPPMPPSSRETQTVIELIRGKQWQEALEAVEPLAAASPDSEQVLLFQVATFQGMGRHEDCQKKALVYLAKYGSSPNRDQVLYIFSNSLYQTGKKEEAVSYLEVAEQNTKDPTLKKNIVIILPRWRAEISRIGIRLGGKTPATPEEKEVLKTLGLRILKMALDDYYQANGGYPAQLPVLLEGTPPYLRRLPEDPANPGKTFEYVQEGEGYRFPAE